jgi:hypothetical protein
MRFMEMKRRLSILAAGSALLLAAACGGGDKSPTGPTGPGGEDPDNPNSVEFRLAALGLVGLPAHLEIEDCKPDPVLQRQDRDQPAFRRLADRPAGARRYR